MPQVASVSQPQVDSNIAPATDVPFYEEVLKWVTERLRPAGFSKPLCKRLAVVICGLVGSDKATMGEVTGAIEALALSQAKGESIARRLQRIAQDARLDPSILRLILEPIMPELLSGQILAHEANKGLPEFHHERFVGVLCVLDESSQKDKVHLLVAGIPIGGIVLPLAVRTWPQNVAMPDGEYHVQVMGLLQDIQAIIPPQLRDHVLLTGDRAYGIPRMLDIVMALDWHWLLRVQGQTQVRMVDGTRHTLRTLVPKPGTQWSSGFGAAQTIEGSESEAVEVFKSAGWRRSQVVAFWGEGQAEPWLLVTSLPAKLERVVEYAQRWAIERLFLSWKSHGWDIEASGINDAKRLGRLMTGVALATLWRLVMGLPRAWEHLADLRARAGRLPRQLRLPGFSGPERPWAAKYSLFTWGRRVAREAGLRERTPRLCWCLPSWEGRTWKDMCRHVYTTARGQFSVCP